MYVLTLLQNVFMLPQCCYEMLLQSGVSVAIACCLCCHIVSRVVTVCCMCCCRDWTWRGARPAAVASPHRRVRYVCAGAQVGAHLTASLL